MLRRLLKDAKRVDWRYALGELVLIVISILIALYISNWNEERKEREFEGKMLLEVEKSIGSELESHLASRIHRIQEIERSTEIVLKYLDDEIPFSDSLHQHFWHLNWRLIFEYQRTAYESLKARGIHQLQSDTLRQMMMEYYDSDHPWVDFFVLDFNTFTTDRMKPYCDENFAILRIDSGQEYEPLNVFTLKESIEFKNLVIGKYGKTRDVRFRLQSLFRKGVRLRNAIRVNLKVEPNVPQK